MKDKLIKLELEAMEKARGLIPEIIETVKKFDGKVPNKRFDTALKKIDQSLRFKTQYNSFVVELYIEHRSVQRPDGCTDYIKNSSLNIIHTAIQSSYGDGACQDGIIRADILIERLNDHEDYLSRSIETITNQLAEIDKIKAEYDRIKKEMSDFTDNTAYMIRDYYGLNFK